MHLQYIRDYPYQEVLIHAGALARVGSFSELKSRTSTKWTSGQYITLNMDRTALHDMELEEKPKTEDNASRW